MPNIDYDGVRRMYPRQKAALTRAVKAGPDHVLATCRKTVAEWNDPAGPFRGAWPDDWARWQRALNDAFGWHNPHTLEAL